MIAQISAAISNPTEMASSFSSTIHSTFTNTSANISSKFSSNYRNITDNYSSLSNKVADKLNDYPYLSNTKSTITSTYSNGTTYIYSLPSSIGNTVHSYTSMFQPVDVNEREIARTDPNSNLQEGIIALNGERTQFVNDILDLYNFKISNDSFKHYDENITFNGPLTHTTGLSNLKALFYGQPKIFANSTTVDYKIIENSLNVVKINLNQRYTLPYVGRAVVQNILITLELGSDNKTIIKHTDTWNGVPTGEGILRKTNAKIISTFVKVPEN